MPRAQTTVLEALAQRLATDPDSLYLDLAAPDGGAVQYSARQMDVESTRLAHALAALGLGRRDRLATLLDNRAEQVVSFRGPRLPESIDWLELRDLPVGAGRMVLKLQRYAQGVGIEVVRNDSGASVRIHV